jgi:hypothetical protein
MREEILKSGRDALLFGIPLIILLLIGIFRLDELFITRRKRNPRSRPPRGVDREGRQIFSDPDGQAQHRRKKP